MPIWLQPYLPIAVVAALDAVFGGLRALLDGIFDDKVFVVSFVSNVLVAALIVFLGDQLGVGVAAVHRRRRRARHPDLLQRRRHPPAGCSRHERPGVRDEPASEPSAQTGPDAGGIGRARLLAALRAKPSRGQLVAAVLLRAARVRRRRPGAGQPGRRGCPALRQTDLVRILDDVTERAARLQAEARDLEDTKAKVSGGSSGSLAALEEARAASQTLGILAGTLAGRRPRHRAHDQRPGGQGRRRRAARRAPGAARRGRRGLRDRRRRRRRVRVIASTYISDGGRTAGSSWTASTLHSPYRIRAIGDPRTLAGALDIPGGVLDVLSQSEAQGTVTQRAAVADHALRPTPTPQYARPAPQKTG